MKMHGERHVTEHKYNPKSANDILLFRLCILKISVF